MPRCDLNLMVKVSVLKSKHSLTKVLKGNLASSKPQLQDAYSDESFLL